MSGEAPTLESRIRRLEAISAALEAEDIELDNALALFSEGVENVRAARAILEDAELRIERLIEETGPAGG
jgi:exodeoxyribonuclease VII small subunit